MSDIIKSIHFFPNGVVVVFDIDGQQVSKLQGSYVRKFITNARKKGYMIDDQIEISLPDGKYAKYDSKNDNYAISTNP